MTRGTLKVNRAGLWTKDYRLSELLVKMLKIVDDHPKGITREKLKELTGISDMASTLGPTYAEESNLYRMRYGKPSLISLGLVKGEVVIEGSDEKVIYMITDRGRTAAEYYHTLSRGKYKQVPTPLLDEAVLRLKQKRLYGFERWTRDDLDTLRSMLPPEYIMTPLEDLQQQMTNRRKAGAYADPVEKSRNQRLSTIKKLILDYWQGNGAIEEIVLAIESGKPAEPSY